MSPDDKLAVAIREIKIDKLLCKEREYKEKYLQIEKEISKLNDEIRHLTEGFD